MAKVVKATTESRQELGKMIPLDVPFTCEIFPANVCNFKCRYCAHSCRPQHLKKEFMDWDIYQKCIDDLAGFPRPLKLLLLAGLGEPLLHPRISDMVRYANEKKAAETVRIITNASLLTPELSDELIEAGLGHLKISIQGLDDEAYHDMCETSIKLEKIIENITYFYQHKKDTVVNVKIVSDAFKHSDDEKRFYKMFDGICDVMNIEHIAPYQDVDYSSLVTEEFVSQSGQMKEANKICQVPFYFYSVYPDGEIIPCCMLMFEDYKTFSFGNVRQLDLAELWNSRKFHEFRLKMLKDERTGVCAECKGFSNMCQPGDNIDQYAEKLIPVFESLGGADELIWRIFGLKIRQKYYLENVRRSRQALM